MSDIDPREFGKMEADVAALKKEVSELNDKMDKLIELVNQGKGAFWAGMGIASIFGGAAGFIVSAFSKVSHVL